jgi:hypothetical protein
VTYLTWPKIVHPEEFSYERKGAGVEDDEIEAP